MKKNISNYLYQVTKFFPLHLALTISSSFNPLHATFEDREVLDEDREFLDRQNLILEGEVLEWTLFYEQKIRELLTETNKDKKTNLEAEIKEVLGDPSDPYYTDVALTRKISKIAKCKGYTDPFVLDEKLYKLTKERIKALKDADAESVLKGSLKVPTDPKILRAIATLEAISSVTDESINGYRQVSFDVVNAFEQHLRSSLEMSDQKIEGADKINFQVRQDLRETIIQEVMKVVNYGVNEITKGYLYFIKDKFNTKKRSSEKTLSERDLS